MRTRSNPVDYSTFVSISDNQRFSKTQVDAPTPPPRNDKRTKKCPVRDIFINVNRIQRPVLGTFEPDMEHLQTQAHEQMSL